MLVAGNAPANSGACCHGSSSALQAADGACKGTCLSALALHFPSIGFLTVCACVVLLCCPAQLLLGQPVMVKPAEAEKNLAWEAAQAAKQAAPTELELAALALAQADAAMPAMMTAATAAAAGPAGPLRLQVSGFKQGLGENEIRQIFEPFGALDSVSVVRDASGQPISVAYVVFRSAVDGRNAMTHWHGQSLLDHVLAVTATGLDAANGGGGAVGLGELDDDDGGLKINAQVSTQHGAAAHSWPARSCALRFIKVQRRHVSSVGMSALHFRLAAQGHRWRACSRFLWLTHLLAACVALCYTETCCAHEPASQQRRHPACSRRCCCALRCPWPGHCRHPARGPAGAWSCLAAARDAGGSPRHGSWAAWRW